LQKAGRRATRCKHCYWCSIFAVLLSLRRAGLRPPTSAISIYSEFWPFLLSPEILAALCVTCSSEPFRLRRLAIPSGFYCRGTPHFPVEFRGRRNIELRPYLRRRGSCIVCGQRNAKSTQFQSQSAHGGRARHTDGRRWRHGTRFVIGSGAHDLEGGLSCNARSGWSCCGGTWPID
jgi:hypothetical protein